MLRRKSQENWSSHHLPHDHLYNGSIASGKAGPAPSSGALAQGPLPGHKAGHCFALLPERIGLIWNREWRIHTYWCCHKRQKSWGRSVKRRLVALTQTKLWSSQKFKRTGKETAKKSSPGILVDLRSQEVCLTCGTCTGITSLNCLELGTPFSLPGNSFFFFHFLHF